MWLCRLEVPLLVRGGLVGDADVQNRGIALDGLDLFQFK